MNILAKISIMRLTVINALRISVFTALIISAVAANPVTAYGSKDAYFIKGRETNIELKQEISKLLDDAQKRAQQQNLTLIKERDELLNQLNSISQRLKQATIDLIAFEQSNRHLEGQVNDVNQQLRHGKIDIDILTQANSRLETRVRELAPQAQTAVELRRELDILKAVHRDLEAKMKDMFLKNQALEAEGQSVKDRSQNLIQDNLASAREKEELQRQVNDLKQQLRQGAIDIDTLRQANSRLETRIRELAPQAQRAVELIRELDILKSSYRDIDANMKDMLLKNQALERENRSVKDRAQSLIQNDLASAREKEELRARINNLNGQLRQGTIDIEIVNQANSRLETRIRELEPQAQRAIELDRQLDILKAEHRSLNTSTKDVLLENQALEQENRSIKDRLQNLLQENKELRKKTDNISQELQQLQEEKSDLETKAAVLVKNSKDVEQESARQKELRAQIEEKAKEIYLKEQDFKRREQELESLRKLVDSLNKEHAPIRKENEELKQQLVLLAEADKKEKIALHEKLGMAYMQSQLFDLAIDAYEKALDIGSSQSEIHYYLGLLYKHAQNDTQKSRYHLQKYLTLTPRSKNRKEVEYIIKAMGN